MSRKIRYTFRLTQNEEYVFRKRYTGSGIDNISEFIRQAVLTAQIKPVPSKELINLRQEAQAIGNNINQIAKVANASGMVSKDKIDKMLMQQKELLANVKLLL